NDPLHAGQFTLSQSVAIDSTYISAVVVTNIDGLHGKTDDVALLDGSGEVYPLLGTGDGMGHVTGVPPTAGGVYTILETVAGSGGTFSTVAFPVPDTADAITAGDFNGDGKQDLVASFGNRHGLAVLIGAGNGRFTALPDNGVFDNVGLSMVAAD